MSRARKTRRGFTLIELLITISIIALMASMILFALYSAQETAKVAKTKTLIAKLDAIVKARWDSYRTRRVPIVIPPLATPPAAAKLRLDALRDLMRMEMPDRWSDIATTVSGVVTPSIPATTIPSPSVWQGYVRRYRVAFANNPTYPTEQNQSAECLYLIVMSAIAEEGDSREVFKPDDVKDTDFDGAPEFVDAWGFPISFLRWAPGFQSELQIVARGPSSTVNASGTQATITAPGAGLSTTPGAYVGGAFVELDPITGLIESDKLGRITGYQNTGATATFTFQTPSYTTQPPFRVNPTGHPFIVLAPDPFDPSGVYPLYGAGPGPPSPDTSAPTFALYPLIYSWGPDKSPDISSKFSSTAPNKYNDAPINNNPFIGFIPGTICPDGPFGAFKDNDGPMGTGNGEQNWLDNIHNHMLGTK